MRAKVIPRSVALLVLPWELAVGYCRSDIHGYGVQTVKHELVFDHEHDHLVSIPAQHRAHISHCPTPRHFACCSHAALVPVRLPILPRVEQSLSPSAHAAMLNAELTPSAPAESGAF